jgi:hypothetical protein
VASTDDRLLTQIDPSTFEVTATVGLGFEPTDIEAVGDSVWVAGGYDHALWRVDRDGLPRTKLSFRERFGPLPAGFDRGPAGLASSKHGLWLAHGSEVTLLDPVSGRAKADVKVGGLWASAIYVCETDLVGSNLGVHRFDRRRLVVGASLSPGFGTLPANWEPRGDARAVADILVARPPVNGPPVRQVWIAWRWEQLWVVQAPIRKPRFLTLRETVDLRYRLAALEFLDDAVWVTSQQEHDELANARSVPLLRRVNPADGRIEATIELEHTPEGIAAANGLLWVALRAP